MEFLYSENRVYLNDEHGKMVAEVTFVPIKDHVMEINHTFVDESLRGGGVASKLMAAAVEYLAKKGMQIHPTCSYAVKWFEKHEDKQSLLAK